MNVPTGSSSGDGAQRLKVGVITGPHGVRGQVRIKAFTEDPATIGDLGPVETAAGRRFDLKVMGLSKGVVLCRLSGIGTRNAAEDLKGTELFVTRDRLPEIDEPDEWYATDLVGLEVWLASGSAIGRVVSVQDFGAGDLLEVALTTSRRTVFVPFTLEVVPVVDIDGGRIEIDPPEGLLDDAPAPRAGEEEIGEAG